MSIVNFSSVAVKDQIVINNAPVEQIEHPLNRILMTLVMAAKANEWANQITGKAIRGLAGHVCGNHDINAAIAVLDKLPVSDAKKVARRLEIALGNFQQVTRAQNGKVNIIEAEFPLLTYDRKTGWSCQYDALLSSDKKEKNFAYDMLCRNRARLPKDWFECLKIEAVQTKEEIADTELAKIDKLVKSIRNKQSQWTNNKNAYKLRRLLELLDNEILSSEDAKIFSTTSNFHGGRK